MSEFFAPLNSDFTLIIPDSPAALIGWLVLFLDILILVVLQRERSFRLNRRSILWLAVLSVLILILTPFMGVLPRFSPVLGAGEVPVQHLMFFAAVPWMIAAGILGVLPATLLAGISGLWLAYLDTHNIFTPLVMMSVAVLFSWSVHQRYRTSLFKWLRFPIIAAVFSLLAVTPLVFIVLALSASGSIAVRVAAALTRFPVVMFSLSGMIMVGGAVCVIVQAIAQDGWGLNTTLRTAPGEIDFRYRLLGFTVPIFLLVMAAVLMSTWTVAQNQARRLLVKQLTAATANAVESFRLFVETGERLLLVIAQSPQFMLESAESTTALMTPTSEAKAFFDQIALFDVEGQLVTGMQHDTLLESLPGDIPFEMLGELSWHSKSIAINFQSDQPVASASVDFFLAVESQPGQVEGILWGRTALAQNRYARLWLSAVDEIVAQGGDVFIVAEDGMLILHAGNGEVFDFRATAANKTTTFFQSTTRDGRATAYYYQPVDGTDWGLAATLPDESIYEMAWNITAPVLIITGAVMGLITLVSWVGLTPLVKEVASISAAINAVAVGVYDLEELDKRVKKQRGYFNTTFKHMLTVHKTRMDRQAKLLSVSSQVTDQLKLTESLHLLLTAALEHGTSDARIVLAKPQQNLPTADKETRYGLGQHAGQLADLDIAVLALVTREDSILVLHPDEIKAYLPANLDLPDFAMLVLIPLRWRDVRLGVLWVSFLEAPHPQEDTLEFLQNLAQIASVAIMNARTFQESRSSSALMRSIIDVSPDPILIVDQAGRVLLHNSHAKQMSGVNTQTIDGLMITSLFTAEDLQAVDWRPELPSVAKEVHFPNGNAYHLISTPIQINPGQMARALIFKDLTPQRQKDLMRTEFVTTVSHELRSPLTLIHGYAKILRLTGNLSEQQDAYISNIIAGVEEMKSLVQKLLEIAHLEGDDPLEMQQFPVEQIVQGVVANLEAQAKQKNIMLSVNLPGDPVVVEGDLTFLTQALKNLLDNAIKFSKMDGAVALGVQAIDDLVVFSVQDEGIGIAPLDQRHLFKKFSRISPNTGIEYEGSGLGLAIVKSIAERHGGRVWLESQLGKGSIFYLEIPRQRDQSP